MQALERRRKEDAEDEAWEPRLERPPLDEERKPYSSAFESQMSDYVVCTKCGNVRRRVQCHTDIGVEVRPMGGEEGSGPISLTKALEKA